MKNLTIKQKKFIRHLFYAIMLFLCASFLFFRHIVNEIYISELKAGNYSSTLEKMLYYPNFPQSYVPHYNEGNASYLQEDYDKAIYEYQEALGLFPSHPTECKIRVNLALSMLHKIDFNDLSNEEKISTVIDQLLAARKVLVEEKCAADTEEDHFHNAEAEKLKQEIDQLLEQLSSSSSQNNNEQEQPQNQENQNQDSSSSSSREEEIQNFLNNQRQEALSQQNQAQNSYNSQNQEIQEPDLKRW